jgi:hypothetical protein
MARFMEEWSSWPDATPESFDVLLQGDRVAVEFRIQATEHERYVEHNRSAFLTIKNDQMGAGTKTGPRERPDDVQLVAVWHSAADDRRVMGTT